MKVDEALELALSLGEVGVQVAAYADGELVVDSWAGKVADTAGAEPVVSSTLFPIFSVTKAVTATALHIQAERGLVDYEAPVATYWPEYGTKGKEAITVRHVLTHRAGVPNMPNDLTPDRLGDWDWIVERLADVEPYAPAGTRNTYLSYSFGWLLGEIVRRTDPRGRPYRQFVQEEICQPLGIEELWLGVPPELEHRVAVLSGASGVPVPQPGTLQYEAVPPKVLFTPSTYNRAEVHQAVIPGAGGIADARSVARFFALLANRGELDGVRLLSEERVLSFLEPRPESAEVDDTYGRPFNAIGMGGFHLQVDQSGVISPAPAEGRVLAHGGAGGSVGWADVDAHVSIAICHNRMFGPPDEPFKALGDAAYEAATGL
jgi:CubicO group peptidase (beta-lactamase class C family)